MRGDGYIKKKKKAFKEKKSGSLLLFKNYLIIYLLRRV